MPITLKRIVKSGMISFKRNGWLSAATIMIMSLVLFVLGLLVMTSALAQTVLSSLESKIDISIYFVPEAQEDDILAVKQEVETLPDVAEVTYISKQDALAIFREKHKNNALIAEALAEIGENPLTASLNIRAVNPADYSKISEFLAAKNYPIVEKINYFENQLIIEQLNSVFSAVRGVGTLLILFFTALAILVAFNTIRLAIYTMREEIGIMRLVGASSWFIRGPFIVSGAIYGIISAIFTMAIFFPFAWAVSPKIATIVPEFNVFQYLVANMWQLILILSLTGMALGVISSIIAIRKYLRV